MRYNPLYRTPYFCRGKPPLVRGAFFISSQPFPCIVFLLKWDLSVSLKKKVS